LKHGINEQRPNLLEYSSTLSDAGFGETSFIWPPAYQLSRSELINCAKDLGAMYPAWSEHGWRINLKRWAIYCYHRVALLPKQRAVDALSVLEDERQRLMRDVLLWASGEVQIFAKKPQVL
jgi:hypothetical protein